MGDDLNVNPIADWSSEYVEPSRTAFQIEQQLYRSEQFSDSKGYYRVIRLREGLELVISDVYHHESVILHEESATPWMELSFCLKGGIFHTIHGHYSRSAEQDGDCFLLLSKDISTTTEWIDGTHSVKVEILINPLVWGTYTSHFWQFGEQQDMLEWLHKKPFNVTIFRMNRDIQIILQQIVSCRLEGTMQSIYLESKAMELMALCAMNWKPASDKLIQPSSVKLSMGDIAKIREARDLLTSRLDQTHTIEALAKEVQLSDWKLKKGFYELHGVTVYSYLRDYRLEQAARMMKEDLLNVSEAAFTVGYSNMSHFAEAFRKKYGMNPSHYRNANVKGRFFSV